MTCCGERERERTRLRGSGADGIGRGKKISIVRARGYTAVLGFFFLSVCLAHGVRGKKDGSRDTIDKKSRLGYFDL